MNNAEDDDVATARYVAISTPTDVHLGAADMQLYAVFSFEASHRRAASPALYTYANRVEDDGAMDAAAS
jgi:hypothetical protein